ncbi:MAG: response regulator [Flavobacteriales bacterium]|nr:response regulator [Flavobacteriales bacterium]
MAEDNPVNQLVTKDLLQSVGVKVVLANDGVEAIKSLESTDFDIVLMDIQMPVMDGYEAMRHIRTELDPKKRIIPILALTAHAIEGEMEKCKAAGASDYLSKPFNPQDLFIKIAGLIGKPPGDTGHHNGHDLDSHEEEWTTDITVLRDFTGGKVKLMISTINVLVEELPKNLQIMEEAVKIKDWERLRAVAHKMKPNIMLIGSEYMRGLIVKIERLAAEQSDLHEIPEMVEQLVMHMPQIIKELKEETKALNLELAETQDKM